MMETGVGSFLDIHGDEGLPFAFVVGTGGVPNYNERIETLEDRFRFVLLDVNPDFQDNYGYDKDTPGQANMTLVTNWIGNHFSCLAYTLEMPFKDDANLLDSDLGWNDQHSLRSGETMSSTILDVIGGLR